MNRTAGSPRVIAVQRGYGGNVRAVRTGAVTGIAAQLAVLGVLAGTVGLSRLFPKSPRFGRHNMGHVDESDTHEMDAGTADCLMLRMAAINRVGFFDPRYFMFGEDVDLCYRLKLGGWKVFYLPTATAKHHRRSSASRARREQNYQRYRAMWTYHFKHHAGGVSAFGNGLVWAQIWGRWVAASVRDSVTRSDPKSS
jgi:GT2 family glycosyltransferase